VNLAYLDRLAEIAQTPVGYSGHERGFHVALAAVARGAAIIEKHFTLDRSGGGPDDSFSLEPAELAALCQGVKTAWSALGCVDYGRKSSEQSNVKFRRSLYFVKDMKAGEVITENCVRSVRPGFGLPPKFMNEILGQVLRRDVRYATPVLQSDLEA
jgi:N-acetylneuraminate synthase